MSYLIDSDIVVDLLLERPVSTLLVADLRRSGIAISTITYLEIVEGVAASNNPSRARAGLRAFLRGTRMLVVSRQIAERAALIRVELRRQKRQTNERSFDTLVAATAIEHGLTLVTRNTRDYADIPGVVLHDQI